MLTLALLGAPPASAGGPTSVLLASPTTQQATGLYSTAPEYNRLQTLLDRTNRGLDADKRARELASASGEYVNITWMVHDVAPWRQDSVIVSDAEDIWINTALGTPPEGNDQWKKAERPAQLHTLLAQLGVIDKVSNPGSAGAADKGGTADKGSTADTAATTTRAATTGASDDTDWWWALPGAAAGAVLALVLRPFAARKLPLPHLRDAERGPRQELRDI
ncbi:hypothetical protein QQY66_30380 [Streptomyces sp. DG2A-72]|uniref:hypothetical protein n=1 Tax=Streptomyces sp. DG2A-72 TaxID=3051386 RepID=UPI00265C3898|nr:hypothetical protein [Streptomyces sp. DG2A-72]MDO0935781.1 hypothetical protein [Streptomyces sp. DG2A-72]